MFIDPITEATERACTLCGNAAVTHRHVMEYHDPILLCGSCADGQVYVCEGCQGNGLMTSAIRLYTSPSLYCPACAAPVLHEYRGQQWQLPWDAMPVVEQETD